MGGVDLVVPIVQTKKHFIRNGVWLGGGMGERGRDIGKGGLRSIK